MRTYKFNKKIINNITNFTNNNYHLIKNAIILANITKHFKLNIEMMFSDENELKMLYKCEKPLVLQKVICHD